MAKDKVTETLVEALKQAEFCLLDFGRRRAALEVGHRLISRDDAGALIYSRQKIRIPDLAAGVRQLRREHHERGQVLILRAQAVAHPRADARTFESDRACVDPHRRLKVIVVIAAH